MSTISSLPITQDIKSIRENYDTSNPVVAEIIKAKEERFKILQALNKQQEEEFASVNIKLASLHPEYQSKNASKEKKTSKRKIHSSLPMVAIRRSTRLLNLSPVVEKDEIGLFPTKGSILQSQIIRPPNDYGPIPGIEIGFHWETRMECSMYGVHRPTVAGIHGGPKGAYSIALSGGYPEDVDEGYSFIYTGAGGRDLKGTSSKPKNLRTAPQTKDQQLEGTNLSLVKSIESKLPIRVIRGYKSPSFYAPETGYRYDGLYQVVKYWEDTGESGFRIYRFHMERIKDQPPPPWEMDKPNQIKQFNINLEYFNKIYESTKKEVLKENIDPEICLTENDKYLQSNCSYEDKDVDSEIEQCIKSFLKAGLNDEWQIKDFLYNFNDCENFLGF